MAAKTEAGGACIRWVGIVGPNADLELGRFLCAWLCEVSAIREAA